jgi:hypothetical protein
MAIVIIIAMFAFYIFAAHFLSYSYLKKKILKSKKWDLNICCGKTDGGGINADIYKHTDVPNFALVKSIYKLPFSDKEFKTVICSHTMEHVDKPYDFFKELERIGEDVTVVIPPLYDLSAVFNIFEHKWIFLSFRKKHRNLPKHIKLPFSDFIQKRFGQINRA